MTNKHAGSMGISSAAEGRAGDAIAAVALGGLGADGSERVFQRVIVQEVIFDPAMLDDKKVDAFVKQYGIKNESFLKAAPGNTIIGKKVIDGTTGADSESQYFFPFFSSHMQMPVKAGEHVWVFYEPGKAKTYGFWITRIHEPRNVEDVNHTHADRKHHVSSTVGTIDKFEGKTTKVPSFANGALVEKGSETKSISTTASASGDVDAYEKMIKETDSGRISDMEDVPRFKKRPGDQVIQGSNNTLIVLGTDRTGPAGQVETDQKAGKVTKKKPTKDRTGKSGTIDMVVGRGQNARTAAKKVKNSIGKDETQKDITQENPNEGDPDFEFDLGRIYVSMDTNADENFNIKLKGINKEDHGPYAVIKVDHVRIIARKTIKFLVQPSFDSPDSACAGFVVKGGNIIAVPADDGLVKLGGEDANLGILCTPLAVSAGGQVTAPPIVSTIGSTVGSAGANGVFAKKVVMK